MTTGLQRNNFIFSGEYDVAIIGGGIIGTATARELLNVYPKLKVVLLEKEKELGVHQTANNSGVIHAGIYYTPGSLKAKLCVEGSKLTMEHCDKKKIPYKKVGKLIVATDEEEVKYLKVLYERGMTNGVPGLELIDSQEKIHKIEPECRGLKAIWSPNTAIVDFKHLAKSHADTFHDAGGEIRLRAEVNIWFSVYSNLNSYLIGLKNRRIWKDRLPSKNC